MFPRRCCALAWVPVAFAAHAAAQIITTVAGTTFTFPATPLPAIAAPLGGPTRLVEDSKGNLYVPDFYNNLILKITPDGMLTVVAGNGTQGNSGDGGPATSAAITGPAGIAMNAAGDIFFISGGTIRKISGAIVTTVVGGGSLAPSDGMAATAASFGLLYDVTLDSSGNLYFVDIGGAAIRKVSGGILTTVAGGSPGFFGDGGPATAAGLNFPTGIAFDPSGNLYIADGNNNRVRKVSRGIITTVAGNGTPGFSGDGGRATDASLYFPVGIGFDSGGALYIADAYNNRIRQVSGSTIFTVAGNGTAAFSGDGGPALQASIDQPVGLLIDPSGNLLISDSFNHRIRKVSSGNITTIAGNGIFKFTGDGGPATLAHLNMPAGLALDPAGNLYIADNANNAVRKVSGGTITTVAGTGAAGSSGDGQPATAATLFGVSDVALDAAGNIYIADQLNSRIREVSNGVIRTVAGRSKYGHSGDGGPATNADLGQPQGIAIDASGNLYIADTGNNVIRKVAQNGIISNFAGNGTAGFAGDNGPPQNAEFNGPQGVTVDSSGAVYVADSNNRRIRKIANGVVTTVAGNGTAGLSGDGGPATSAQIGIPSRVALDSAGNLFFSGAGVVREVSRGTITTVAGGGNVFPGDGGPARSAQITPAGIAIDAAGNLYIADQGHDRIRKVLAASASFQVSSTALSFGGTAGSPSPSPQTVTLSPSIAGLTFSASSSVPWLTVSPASGTMPATISVTADASQLAAAAGNYSAVVTINAPNASPATRSIAVSFAVSAALPGNLVVSSSSLAFSFTQGAAPGAQQLTISNQGSGSVRYSAAFNANGGNWLNVAPADGVVTPSAPATLTVTVTPANLGVGSYSGSILIFSPDTRQQILVPVIVAISAPPQKITLSQSGLTFTAVAQGGSVLPQSLGILNTGSGTMSYTVQVSTQPGASGWLSVSPNSGTVTRPFLDVGFVNVSVDAHALSTGTYYGQVTVTAPGASNSPQTAVVVLTVLPPGSNPGPVVRPTGLVFTGVAGAGSPSSQNVAVANVTANPTTFGSSIAYVNGGSIQYQPTNSVVQPDTPTQIVVQPDFTNFTPGVYRSALTLAFDDGSNPVISILSVVAPGGSPGAAFSQGAAEKEKSLADGTCTPAKLLPQFKQVGFGSSVTASNPADIEVDVVDDCGMRMTGGSVVVSFSNGDPPLPLVSLQNGSWAGSWQPGPQVPNVTLSAKALSPAQALTATTQATASVQQTAQTTPVLAGLPLGPYAPGDLFLLKGIALASGQASSTSLPLPDQLAGVTVYVGGSKSSLLYADAGEVLGLVPAGVATNTLQQVILQRDNALGIAAPATIAPAHPAILTNDGSGSGQGLIYAKGVLADTSSPVHPGDTIVIYCTGLGTTDASGAATSAPMVTIGGQSAQVSYAGIALPANYPAGGAPTVLGGAGHVALGGLYQITAMVPSGLLGGAASVVISSAGQRSPAGVTLRVLGQAGILPNITSLNTAYGTSDIGQNDFIEIHGSNLASAVAGPAALATQLGGSSVSVNGKPALLYYVSPTQINALTPLDNALGPALVVVTNNGVPSASFNANLRAVTPTFLRFGDNQHITATHADGSLVGPGSLGTSFSPAAPGETIVTYAVGFGLPSTPLTSGSASQTGQLPATPVCQVGGTPAAVAYAGLNGFAGLYQINLVVPSTASNGGNPVSCSYGGQATPAGTLLSVQR